jgi:hypothetical protein
MGFSQNVINAITLKHSQSIANTFVDKAIFEETLFTSHIQDSRDVWAEVLPQNNPNLAVTNFQVRKVTNSVLIEDLTVANSQGWFLADRSPWKRINIKLTGTDLGYTNIANLTVRKSTGTILIIDQDYSANLTTGLITLLNENNASDNEPVIANFTLTSGYSHCKDSIPAFRYGILYALKLYEYNGTYIPSSKQPDNLTDGNNGWIIDYKAGYIYCTTAPVWQKPLRADFYYYIGNTLEHNYENLNKISTIESKLKKHNHIAQNIGSGLSMTVTQV